MPMYPVLALRKPSVLLTGGPGGTPLENGKIPANLLISCGLRSFVMLQPASDAFRALRWRASAEAGINLDATGTYRSYDQQVTLFLDRYTTDSTKALHNPDGSIADRRVWNGVAYYRYRGASAAVPGNSNHGWGLAADLAEQYDADPEADQIRTATLNWLLTCVQDFGFSWEMQSEPWHIRYVMGDVVAPEVQSWIAAGRPEPGAPPIIIPPQPEPIPPTPTDWLEATIMSLPTQKQGDSGEHTQSIQHLLTARGIWSDSPANHDGIFGPGTDSAVRKFQQQKGLKVDGVVGPKTWDALLTKV